MIEHDLALVFGLCAAVPGWALWLRSRGRLKRLEAERVRLECEINLDPLTCALQHRALRRIISTRGVPPQGCVFCDLNNLKATNDTYGHMEGDRLIRAAADVIREAAGKGSLFRVGGDELIFLPDEDAPNPAGLCRQIDAAVEAWSAGRAVPLSLAVGWSGPGAGESWEELIMRAEQAMYRDKERKKRAAPDGKKGGNDDG